MRNRLTSTIKQYSDKHIRPTQHPDITLSDIRNLMGWAVRDRIPVGTRFSARPDQPWGPPSLLYNGYQVFPGGYVRPGRADHSPPSNVAVIEE